jgi:U4/U6.U5 tri-snRNP-associated protein 1
LKKRQRAHEKDLAAKRHRDMEEADRAADYDETDLTGLKVGHGAEEFLEGEDIILTLKDSRVLAGEGELPNIPHK